jgi:hypothetical protein
LVSSNSSSDYSLGIFKFNQRRSLKIPKEYSEEKFEDTKGVIRIRKSRKNKQHNGQKDKQ